MAKKVEGGFACTECNKVYPDPQKADACREEHGMIYVPFTKTEINRLMNGLFLQDFSIIPESVMEKLRKYQRMQ